MDVQYNSVGGRLNIYDFGNELCNLGARITARGMVVERNGVVLRIIGPEQLRVWRKGDLEPLVSYQSVPVAGKAAGMPEVHRNYFLTSTLSKILQARARGESFQLPASKIIAEPPALPADFLNVEPIDSLEVLDHGVQSGTLNVYSYGEGICHIGHRIGACGLVVERDGFVLRVVGQDFVRVWRKGDPEPPNSHRGVGIACTAVGLPVQQAPFFLTVPLRKKLLELAGEEEAIAEMKSRSSDEAPEGTSEENLRVISASSEKSPGRKRLRRGGDEFEKSGE